MACGHGITCKWYLEIISTVADVGPVCSNVGALMTVQIQTALRDDNGTNLDDVNSAKLVAVWWRRRRVDACAR